MEAKIASFDTQHSTEGSSTHTIRKVPTCVTAGIVIGKNCNVALLCVWVSTLDLYPINGTKS